jgi:hypothetical protein
VAGLSLYAAYKRDTKYLLHWMVSASNTIIRRLPTSEHGALSVSINVTGQITVSKMVSMAQLIVKHASTIPFAIYSLLESIIDARIQAHSFFEKAASQNPDPELERNNASHRYFIDALQQVLDTMSREKWQKGRDDTPSAVSERDLEDLTMSNRFSILNLDEVPQDEGDESDGASPSPVRRKHAKPGKGKKAKAKKNKGNRPSPPTRAVDAEDVPLESYRLVEESEEVKEGARGWRQTTCWSSWTWPRQLLLCAPRSSRCGKTSPTGDTTAPWLPPTRTWPSRR